MMLNFDKLEMLNGALRFTPELLLLDIVLIVYSILDWIYLYKKTGYIIDYWRFFCLYNIYIRFLLMYPFAASFYNFISTGSNIFYIDQYVDEAYIISIVGFICMLIGRLLCGKKQARRKNLLENMIYSNLQSIKFYKLMCIFSIISFVGMFLILIKYPEYFLSLRSIAMVNTSLGPIMNALGSCSMCAFIYLSLYYWNKKEKVALFFISINIIAILLTGNRSTLISPILIFILIYCCINEEKIKNPKQWIKMIMMIIGLFIIAIEISELRMNDESELKTLGSIVQFFYGNNLSDLRDFSWILTGFENNFVFGKTYLAALVSFIPSSILEFRSEYALGVITNKFANIEGFHFGLRGGIFCEPYLNFGYIGVVIVGIFIGYYLQYINNSFLENIKNKNIYLAYIFIFSFMFVSTFFIQSAVFFIMYVYLVINIVGVIIRHVKY